MGCQATGGQFASESPVIASVKSRKGNAVADSEQLARIAKIPKREFMRRGINQHTLEKICRGKPVGVTKLAKCLKTLEDYEQEKG